MIMSINEKYKTNFLIVLLFVCGKHVNYAKVYVSLCKTTILPIYDLHTYKKTYSISYNFSPKVRWIFSI